MSLEQESTGTETTPATTGASSRTESTTESATETTTGVTETDSASLTDKITGAFDRAVAGQEQEDTEGKRQTDDSVSSTGQAAASSQESSDSTPPQDDTDTTGSGANEGTSGQAAPEAADASTPAESLTPPDNWPEDRRKAFSTLPAEGKSTLMSIYRDMERGLKQSFDKLSTERKTLAENYGLEADQLKSLADRAKTFQKDPVAVINQLAEEAGIDVFFQNENEEIPEFDSQSDLVKYMRDQSRNAARQAAADETRHLKEQRHKEEIKLRMEQEFAQAYQKHPDLPDHREAVIKYISGFNLPVEMAYRLATWDGLTSLAQTGQTSRSELDKAKAELEKLQKLATMPPGRPDGQSNRLKANGMNMFESAYAAAEKASGRQSG